MKRRSILFLAVLLLLAGCKPADRRGSSPAEPTGNPAASPVVRSGVAAVPGDFFLRASCGSPRSSEPWDKIVVITADGTALYRENSSKEHPRVFDIVVRYQLSLPDLYDIYAVVKEADLFGMRKFILDETIDRWYVELEGRADGMSNKVVKSVKTPGDERGFDMLCLKLNQYLPSGCEIESDFLSAHRAAPKLLRKESAKAVNLDLAIAVYLQEIDAIPAKDRVESYFALASLYARKKDFEKAKKYTAIYKMVGTEYNHLRLEKMIEEGRAKKGTEKKSGAETGGKTK